jgi:hypothetical protein
LADLEVLTERLECTDWTQNKSAKLAESGALAFGYQKSDAA